MREKRVSKRDNLFVASRFVLPEHREMYIRIKAEELRYVPPELDEEKMAEMSGRVWEALQTGRSAMLTYFDGKRPCRLTGRVAHVDQAVKKIKLHTAEKTVWIPFSSLLAVELEATP
ncbi:YolD-like family protein [Brevibacillus borstelensis]|uniref:YolD-like family protein n=1 Tax=Brevibacillus borstelensis TaxID=45462 RepID=UPI0030BC9C82